MKLSHCLIPATLLAATSISEAATVFAQIHDITSSTTQDYVFTEGASSITLRAVYTATNNGTASGAFTSLDGQTHVGNNADGASDAGNHFRNNGTNVEGFTVSISLLSANNVNTSTIAFSFDSLGVRELSGGSTDFSWVSSSTTLTTTAATGEQLETLDTSTYGNIANVAYTGTFSLPTNGQLLQLSDTVTGGNGVALTANFSAVPEPSSTALLGLGGLALILRRRS